MKERGDDHLEGAHLFVALFDGISPISRYFLETFAEMGSIRWVGGRSVPFPPENILLFVF